MKRFAAPSGSRLFVFALLALAAGLYSLAARPSTDSEPTARGHASAPAPDSGGTSTSKGMHVSAEATTHRASRPPSTRSLRETGLGQLALARDLLAAGEYESAIETYRRAAELYPSAQTHAALGGLYFKLAARSLAYVEFRKAVELDPDNADLWIDLANAEHLRTAIGHSWHAIKKARDAEPGIRIVQNRAGFYQRDASDPNFHTSPGSYTQRRIP